MAASMLYSTTVLLPRLEAYNHLPLGWTLISAPLFGPLYPRGRVERFWISLSTVEYYLRGDIPGRKKA